MLITSLIEQKLINKITKGNYNIGEFVTLKHKQTIKYNYFIQRISEGYPLDYLIGFLDINSIRIFLKKGVFIPRPCTEELINIATESLKGGKIDEVVDICAGSGVIGLSLARIFPNISFTLIEKSKVAVDKIIQSIDFNQLKNIKVINQNALNIDYRNFKNYMVICNPPYVPNKNVYNSVRYEPKSAIYSGKDGLTFFNKFIKMLAINYPIQLLFELDPQNIEFAKSKITSYTSISILYDAENFRRFLICNDLIKK
jgi:release factor glutamine methyltransferase